MSSVLPYSRLRGTLGYTSDPRSQGPGRDDVHVSVGTTSPVGESGSSVPFYKVLKCSLGIVKEVSYTSV